LGAGIGNFTEFFLDKELVVAVDIHEPALEYLRRKFSGRNNVVIRGIDIGTPGIMELAEYRADTIVCLNVLEHLANDDVVLANMHRVIGRSGRVALLVPAYQSLYGSMDKVLGHCRRYTKEDLDVKLKAAGFAIKDLFYMNTVGVAGWFFNNRILKITEEPRNQFAFFDRFVVPWLWKVETYARPPFGLSLIAIAEK
jgi:2-polyprenyl-3-methyl-5-hydroxy-6-metoxy-1,4-benzoquinol methylase